MLRKIAIVTGVWIVCLHSAAFAQESLENGIRRAFYQSGALLSEEMIKAGKREGTFNTFYENGALQSVGQYRDDKEEGIFHKYYQNGKLMLEVEYKEGRMNGMVRFYSQQGKLIRQWDSSQYNTEKFRRAFNSDRPFDVSGDAKQKKFYALTVIPQDISLSETNDKD